MNSPVDPSGHDSSVASAADERAFWEADPSTADAGGGQPNSPADSDLAGFGDPLNDPPGDDPPGFYPDDPDLEQGAHSGSDDAYVADSAAAKKRKAKLLLAGILGGLLLVIGGGFGLKTYLGNQAAAQRAEQAQLMAAAQAPRKVEPAAPQPQPPASAAVRQTVVDEPPAQLPQSQGAEPAGGPLQSAAPAQALEGADVLASQQQMALSEAGEPGVQEKLDTLGQATLRIKSDTESLSKSQLEVAAQLNDHGQRLANIELLLRQLQGTLEMLQASSSRTAAKPEASKSTATRAKQAQAPVAKKAAAEPKPQAKAPSTPPPRKGSDGIARATGQGIAGYSVVATYPSTTQPGMAPQKAWVTNGAQIVELAVGSRFNGAKVTRIEGTTVYTTAGVIPAVR